LGFGRAARTRLFRLITTQKKCAARPLHIAASLYIIISESRKISLREQKSEKVFNKSTAGGNCEI
jgi:hypothetical protein